MVDCLVCNAAESTTHLFKCKDWATSSLIKHLKQHPDYQEKFNILKEAGTAAAPKIKEFLSGLTFF
jgi:hypothetical protein